jgi:hypothetical protein
MRADGLKKMLSEDARGKFGRGGGFGRIAFGYNFFGFYSEFSGIYQKHYYCGKPYISKMKFYRPSNPRTDKQQAWRNKFASGMQAWGALEPEVKEQWSIKAKKERIPAYSLFLRQYLLT